MTIVKFLMNQPDRRGGRDRGRDMDVVVVREGVIAEVDISNVALALRSWETGHFGVAVVRLENPMVFPR